MHTRYELSQKQEIDRRSLQRDLTREGHCLMYTTSACMHAHMYTHSGLISSHPIPRAMYTSALALPSTQIVCVHRPACIAHGWAICAQRSNPRHWKRGPPEGRASTFSRIELRALTGPMVLKHHLLAGFLGRKAMRHWAPCMSTLARFAVSA